MALAALRKCGEVGCNRLVREARCKEHGKRAKDDRLSASKRGYGRRWEKVRSMHLAEYPLCTDCLALGRTEPAVDVHHLVRLVDVPERAYEQANLMSLCHQCHSRRTRRGE